MPVLLHLHGVLHSCGVRPSLLKLPQPPHCLFIGAAILLHRNFIFFLFLSFFFIPFLPCFLLLPLPLIRSFIHLK